MAAAAAAGGGVGVGNGVANGNGNGNGNGYASDYSDDDRDEYFSLLPSKVVQHVFGYLDAMTLLKCAQVNKKWNKESEKPMLWWHQCNAIWYDDGDAPKTMSRKDKKKNWKASYLSISGAYRPVSFVVQLETRGTTTWEKDEVTKDEQRAYYKGIKSKPKGKKPTREAKEDRFMYS